MIRILANDGIAEDGKLLLEEAGYEVDTNKVPQDMLPEVLNNYDALIVRSATKVRKDLIDKAPNLKLIARAGVGLDNIDAEYAHQKGIKVVNTPAASSQSVAELVFAHIFSLARFLHFSHREMPAKGATIFKDLKNDYSNGVQIRGKTLGIIGFGRIGQASARMGLGLGMKVIASDPFVPAADIDINVFDSNSVSLSVKVETTDLEKVFTASDFITLHVPGSDKPLIGRDEIAIMKDGVFLVNTARGGAIDEDALLEGINNGKIAGVGLDVFANEPIPRKEILEHPRISLTPHIGASTVEAQMNIGLELAELILNFFGEEE